MRKGEWERETCSSFALLKALLSMVSRVQSVLLLGIVKVFSLRSRTFVETCIDGNATTVWNRLNY